MKMPDTVVVIRPSGTDTYGNKNASWVDATERVTKGLHLEAASSSLGVQNRRDILLMGPDEDVLDSDRVRIDDVVYAVNGDPVFVRSPSKSVLTQLVLKRIAGGT